jgi:hypothetical protein
MAGFTGQDTRFAARSVSRRSVDPASTMGCNATTLPGERFLLFVTAMVLPLENHIHVLPNVSIIFLLFSVLAGYVAINRLLCLDRVWMHPVFVASYLFTGVIVALEYASPFSSYKNILSFALMIAGAIIVASLCRDRAALKMLMYGFIGAGVWLSALLLLTMYGTLNEIVVKDYEGASQAREEAFRDAPITGNPNALAINCVQGGVVAIAFALGSRGLANRNFFAVIGIFCMVASTLPMSRGAIVNALVSLAVMLKSYGIRQGRVWLLAGLLALSAVVLVPGAIWSRMVVMIEEGQKESRANFYEVAIQHAEDYWFTGVGAGNYYEKWGFEKGFARGNFGGYRVYGVHNTFLQLLINWGVIGLSAYLGIIWLAYRCLPCTGGKDEIEIGILVLTLTLLLVMPFAHDFGWKQFSLGLGVLVAYQRWLAPNNGAQL